jgi:hypothetical protein
MKLPIVKDPSLIGRHMKIHAWIIHPDNHIEGHIFEHLKVSEDYTISFSFPKKLSLDIYKTEMED